MQEAELVELAAMSGLQPSGGMRARPQPETWKEAFGKVRSAALDFIDSAAALPLRFGHFGSDPELSASARAKRIVALNFTISSWKQMAGISERDIDPKAIGVLNRYYEYVLVADKVIDSGGESGPYTDFAKAKSFRRARKRLFESVSELGGRKEAEIRRLIAYSDGVMIDSLVRLGASMAKGEDGLGGEKALAALQERRGKMRGKYREAQDATLIAADELDLRGALESRYGTTGQLMRASIRILNIAHGVPEWKAEGIERSYVQISILMQLRDDTEDVRGDMRNGIKDNLFYQILRRNHRELEAVRSAEENLSIRRLERLAPESYSDARELYGRIFSAVRDTPDFYGSRIVTRMKFKV